MDSITFARTTAGELGGDPGRIVLAGWSLGANAAAAVAERPGIADGWHPSGLVGLAGSYDESPFDGHPDAGDPVGGAGRPALLAHGTEDPVVPPAGSVAAAGRLAEAGWRVVLRQLDTDHAGIIGTEYNPWRRRCVPTTDPGRLGHARGGRPGRGLRWPSARTDPSGAPAARRRGGPAQPARNRRTCPLTSSGFSSWRKWPAPSTTTSSEPGARWSVTGPMISRPMQPSAAPWR